MKKKIFNLVKLITSRMFYLFLGIFMVLGIGAVYAAHQYGDVTAGTSTLTADLWNHLKDKVNEVDKSNDPCILTFTRSGDMCMASPRRYIQFHNTTNTSDGTSGAWQTQLVNHLLPTNAKIAIVQILCGEATVWMKATGDGVTVLNEDANLSDYNVVCSAGNNDTDWSAFRNFYWIPVDAGKHFDYYIRANNAPSVTVKMRLVGYVD